MKSCCFSSSPLPLHLLSVLVMAGIPLLLSNPVFYRNCHDAEFKCGNISAGYPFHGGERGPECGHPDLRLDCETENNITIIEIYDVGYQVLDIHPERRTLTLAREDFMNSLCSPQTEYSILDSMLVELVYAPAYANITLLYDCPDSPVPLLNDSFNCNERGAKYKNVSVSTEYIDPEACSAGVTVPIPQSFLPEIGNSTSLKEALKTKFEVEWKVDTQACPKCERSGGECGFNSDNQTVCYCLEPSPDWTECLAVTPSAFSVR